MLPGAVNAVQQMQAYTPAPMDHAPAPVQAPAPRKTAQFRQWNTEQVENWVKDSKLDRYGSMKFCLHTDNGECKKLKPV